MPYQVEICWICGKAVTPEQYKRDEFGFPAHDGCKNLPKYERTTARKSDDQNDDCLRGSNCGAIKTPSEEGVIAGFKSAS